MSRSGRRCRARASPTLARIGDCKAPGLIAHAVYDGHKLAREFGEDPASIIVRRERALA